MNITGNLTRRPELRLLDTERRYVCRLRIAVTGRRRNLHTGEWVDKPNYFDVPVCGRRAVDAAYGLAEGQGVAITGRLEWREWIDEGGARREAIEIDTETVEAR